MRELSKVWWSHLWIWFPQNRHFRLVIHFENLWRNPCICPLLFICLWCDACWLYTVEAFLLLSPFLLFSDDYLILPSGNLQIISVSAQHQGMYKCGAVNPVTKETVIQSHGTKLSVKCKLDDVKSRRSVYMSALLCQTNERLCLFFGLFRFRPLLFSADRLSQNPKDCFDWEVAAADLGVCCVW